MTVVHSMTVASPETRGAEVRRRQRRLQHNVFQQDFMAGGAIDGEFGPETGRACIRAKFWLGYATKDQTPIYGPFLDAYLLGTTKLPAVQERRRETRLKARARTPLREKALANAIADIGMKEDPPNSNWSPISHRWGVQGAWCAMSVSEWYIDAGSKAFVLHRDWAYVPFMLAAAAHGGHGLALIRWTYVEPGDIVTFDWQGDGTADHTGLFRHWLVKGQMFATVEGNTGVGNDSNGGRVMERERSIGQVAKINGAPGLIRVGR